MTTTTMHPMGIVTIGVVLATVGSWSFQPDRVSVGDRPEVTRARVTQ